MLSLPSNLAYQIAPSFSSAEKWDPIAELFLSRNYVAISPVSIGTFITLWGLFLTCVHATLSKSLVLFSSETGWHRQFLNCTTKNKTQ
ncbi:hypothetical protein BDV34DRAFT_35142 [Aspergillus parasiticus]|uniref:Uncharacterized protein n=1 Tax=Aspergillus parasiticus TaxID=5067 RepID=A0A5N6D3M0_ASPPA|nr:hypothetical protein BDV34DRAFT_35142 [Aspergillus parasiticus]